MSAAGPESEKSPRPSVAPGALTALLHDLARAPAEPAKELPSFRPGQIVGRFEILREIGRGGFGIVYEARDRELGRTVAFKAVRAGGNVNFREERLLHEAEAAAQLAHPNIVTLHDVGHCEGGPYLVLELLRGQTLAARLEHGALPVREAVRIAVEVAKGLAQAHAQGVVHRDLTPGNIFLCDDCQVKVLDFGMAHAFGQRRFDGGTASYMAPEQWRGAPEDERTDVFALGVVLHRMLAGELPFGNRKKQEDASPAPRLEVPDDPGVGNLVARMLEKDPVKRPRDAGEVLAALATLLLELERAPASRGSSVRARQRSHRFSRRTTLLLTGLGAAILAGGGWYALHRFRTGTAPETAIASTAAGAMPSVAVLPFVDMSPQHDQEYLADGVAEQILNALARVEALRVPGRTSSFYFKGKGAKLSEIARELHVANVLEGSVRKDGTRVRVTAQLVRVEDERPLWSETYDRELTGIFAVQDGIAQAVVEALRVKLLPGAAPTTNRHHTRNPEAYSQYLLGRQFWARGTNDGDRRAAEAYRRALALDPEYAAAHAWLGAALYYLHRGAPTIGAAASYRREALEEAEKAVALAPDLADGYLARGSIRHQWLRDWSGAQADLSRAVSLDPGDSSAHRRRAVVLAYQGQLAEGIREVRRALELDPLDAAAWMSLAQFLEAEGKLDEAMSAARRAMEIRPEGQDPHYRLAREYLLVGQPAAALAEARSAHDDEFLQITAIAEHELRREPESRRALEKLIETHGHVSAENVAEVYAWIGDKERAFKWLDAALDQDLSGLKIDPFLRNLHHDPRFTALLRKMNLSVE